MMRGVKDYYLISGVTTRGLCEVGAYHNSVDLANRLQRVLAAEAAEAERTDPEKGRRIRQLAQGLTEIGTTVAAKLGAEMLKP